MIRRLRVWLIYVCVQACLVGFSGETIAQPDPGSALASDDELTHGIYERERIHLKGVIEIGYPFLSLPTTIAYGTSQEWFGFSIAPSIRSDALRGWFGFRFKNRNINFRLGGYGAYSLRRKFLERRVSYDPDDWNAGGEPRASHFTLDSQLKIRGFWGNWRLETLLGVYRIYLPEKGYNVTEENLRIIVQGPWAWRVGGILDHLWQGAYPFRLGVQFELLHAVGRDAFTIRAGLTGNFYLSESFSAFILLSYPVLSPDFLGLRGGWYRVGVDYRWST